MEATAQGADMDTSGLTITAFLPGATTSQGRSSSPGTPQERLHTRASESQPSQGSQASSRTTWRSASLLTFASPELEAAFQAYLSSRPNMWTLFVIGHCTVGFGGLCYQYLAASPTQRALLPHLWYLGLLSPVGVLAMLCLLLMCPTWYNNHRRALHTAHMLIFISVFRRQREVLLWHRRLESSIAATLAQRIQFFAMENFFGSLIWLKVLAFPVGRVPDLALATLFLLVEVTANPLVCSTMARLRVGGLVTMSREPMWIVEAASGWIHGTPAGILGAMAGAALPRVVTCPLALAFWQVVGWWAACHMVFAAEISKRREFLRTTAARDLVGPVHLASALMWPFGRVTKLLNLALASVAISSSACLVWLGLVSCGYN